MYHKQEFRSNLNEFLLTFILAFIKLKLALAILCAVVAFLTLENQRSAMTAKPILIVTGAVSVAQCICRLII